MRAAQIGVLQPFNAFDMTRLHGVFTTRVGMGPVSGVYIEGIKQFSPRAWGWSDAEPSEPDDAGVFRTRVGMV